MKLVPVGRYIIEAPEDSRINDYKKDHILYDSALGMLLSEISSDDPDGIFIDIGANIGDTAANFATHVSNPIVCVEGGSVYMPHLRDNAYLIGKQVTILEKFIKPSASRDYELSYLVERGTGSLSRREADGRAVDDSLCMSVAELWDTITTHQKRVALCKVDTDGFDAPILADVLAIEDVICFFECDFRIDNGITSLKMWMDLLGLIESRAYSAIIYDNCGIPMLTMECLSMKQIIDLQGYVRTQFMIGCQRIHYYDIWIFPPHKRATYDTICRRLRHQLLKPIG